MNWVAVQELGNYLAQGEDGKMLACPIRQDGSMAGDDEMVECDDQKEALRLFSEALEAENS